MVAAGEGRTSDAVDARERVAGLTAEFAAQMSTVDSTTELISVMGHACRAVVDADAGSFAMKAGDELRLHDLHGIDEQIAVAFQVMGPDDPNPIADCVRTGRPLFYDSARALATAYPHLSAAIDQGSHEAYAAVPLSAAVDATGAITVMWDGPRTVRPWERHALIRLADVCGRLLPRVRSLEDDRGLAAIESRLAGATSVEEIVDILVPDGQKLVGGASGQLGMVDGDRIVQMAALALPPPHGQRWTEVPLTEHLPVAEAIRHNRTIVVADDEAWQRYPAALATRDAMGVEALVVAPFNISTATAGALAFSFANAADAGERQRSVCERLATIAGRSLQRAQLFDTEHRLRVELQASVAKTRAAERRLRNVLDGLFVNVALTTPEGILVEANQTGYDLSGLGPEHAVGKRFWDLPFWPADARRIVAEGVREAAGGRTVRFDVTAEFDGQPVPFDFQIVPITDGADDVHFLVMSSIDISQRVRNEARQHQLLNRQRAISRRLQRSLLPRTLPDPPNADLEARYKAAGDELHVGGDWYDAFWFGPRRLALTIGDIVGRGIDAAAATGQIRAATRALADTSRGPADLVTRLDRFASSIPAATAATMIYAEVDLDSGQVRLCRAGHIPPLIVDPSGTARFVDDHGSPPLGVIDDAVRGECRFVLEQRAWLLLCTDGLVERRGESLSTGLARFAETAARVCRDGPIDKCLDAVIQSVLVPESTQDDLCAVALLRH